MTSFPRHHASPARHTLRWKLVITSCVALLALAQTACTVAPVQEMSDARQAVQAARDAGAQNQVPDRFTKAEESLKSAESKLKQGLYREARSEAIIARDQAIKAREEVRQTIDTAPN